MVLPSPPIWVGGPCYGSEIEKRKCFPSLSQLLYLSLFYVLCCVHAKCFSHIWLFVTVSTVAHQAPLSMGFSRREYWSGLPCPPPGNLPDPGIKPASLKSPALAGQFFTTRATGEALLKYWSRSMFVKFPCSVSTIRTHGAHKYSRGIIISSKSLSGHVSKATLCPSKTTATQGFTPKIPTGLLNQRLGRKDVSGIYHNFGGLKFPHCTALFISPTLHFCI